MMNNILRSLYRVEWEVHFNGIIACELLSREKFKVEHVLPKGDAAAHVALNLGRLRLANGDRGALGRSYLSRIWRTARWWRGD